MITALRKIFALRSSGKHFVQSLRNFSINFFRNPAAKQVVSNNWFVCVDWTDVTRKKRELKRVFSCCIFQSIAGVIRVFPVRVRAVRSSALRPIEFHLPSTAALCVCRVHGLCESIGRGTMQTSHWNATVSPFACRLILTKTRNEYGTSVFRAANRSRTVVQCSVRSMLQHGAFYVHTLLRPMQAHTFLIAL